MTYRDNPEELLDRAVEAVRDDAPDAAAVRRAADRVWGELSTRTAGADDAEAASAVESIESCDDYRALIPAYLAGELSPGRRLLLEDHSRECVTCRRALLAARSGEAEPAARPAAERAVRPRRRWLPLAAAAAALVAAVAVGALLWGGWLGGGTVGTVASVDGSLLAVEAAEGAMAPLSGGAVLAAGAPVRTAKGSHAVVRLGDGSQVEMAERTQIHVREGFGGATVYVDRGSVIVEAAEQRRGHLFVVTDEARVAVTGTIFSVQHGVKGSRVSVIEGEVRVRQGRDETVLHPGEQVTSRASLAAVPLEDEISWSRNVDRYTELLTELTALRREIARRVEPAELRFEGELASAVPADTRVYVALPNISESLAESYEVIRERMVESPMLAQWWDEQTPAARAELERSIERLRGFGSYLGPEIVIALASAPGQDGDPEELVMLATVERPDSFRVYLAEELERLEAEHGDGSTDALVLVDDPAALGGDEEGLLLWLGDGMLVASPRADRLQATLADLARGDSGFPATPLGESVAAAYADGTQWLLAADLAALVRREVAADAELADSGLGDVEHLVVERVDDGERATVTAALTFGAERRGIASWLAAPAPMGSLEFVSSEAHAAAAFVVKEPTALLDDLAAMADEGASDLQELESELGLSLRRDLAAPLGGEVAFALDGPFLPQPSWKLVLEVYDPGTLQHALETAAAEADRRLRAEGGAGVALTSETVDGRTYHRIGKVGEAGGVHYVYADGYLVAAPSRAVLQRTLDQRAAGDTLPRSARFRDLLPLDGRADFSALVFQHVGPLLSPLAGSLGRVAGSELSDEQLHALGELAQQTEPSLAYAYGEPDRILVAGTGPGGPFGLGLNALTGLGGLASMGEALSAAAAEGAAVGRVE